MGRASIRLRAGVAAATIYQRLCDQRHFHPTRSTFATAIRSVRRDGFAVLPEYVDRAWCGAAVAELREAFEHHRLQVDDEGSDRRLWGAERYSSHAATFGAALDLRAAAMQYLRTRAESMTALVGQLVPVEGNRGSGGGWHRDSAFQPQFKAILYLSDVGSENGPLQYVRGSNRLRSVLHSLEIDARTGITRFEEHDFTATDPVDTLIGDAGTLLLVDTRGMHRGAPILAGERWAITNYYFPLHHRARFDAGFSEVLRATPT